MASLDQIKPAIVANNNDTAATQESVPKWSDVSANPNYMTAGAETRRQVRDAYFTKVVAPHFPEEQQALVKQKFLDASDSSIEDSSLGEIASGWVDNAAPAIVGGLASANKAIIDVGSVANKTAFDDRLAQRRGKLIDEKTTGFADALLQGVDRTLLEGEQLLGDVGFATMMIPSAIATTFDPDASETMGEIAKEAALQVSENQPRTSGDWSGKGILNATGTSLMQNTIPMAAGLITRSPSVALAPMAAVSGGDAYRRQTEAGRDPYQAALPALATALGEVVGEKMPFDELMGTTVTNFVKKVPRVAAAESLGEGVTSIVQSLVDYTTINPDMTVGEALNDLGYNMVVGGTSGAATGAALHPLTPKGEEKELPASPQIPSAPIVEPSPEQTLEQFAAEEGIQLPQANVDPQALPAQGAPLPATAPLSSPVPEPAATPAAGSAAELEQVLSSPETPVDQITANNDGFVLIDVDTGEGTDGEGQVWYNDQTGEFREYVEGQPAPVALDLAMNRIGAEVVKEGTKSTPIAASTTEDMRVAEQVANPEPTEAQKAAGNYQKGHVKIQGLDITIENAKGSQRRGKDANGQPWEVTMPATYGYVKRTEGADGDHVDVYIGDNPQSEKVIVIDQFDPETNKFDEHKVMIGFDNQRQAGEAYQGAFNDGSARQRAGGATEMTLPEFRDWLKNGDTKSPLSNYARTKGSTPTTQAAPAKRKKKASATKTLLEFLSSTGGLRDTGGDLKAMNGEKWHTAKSFRAKLINDSTGQSLDDAALRAWEEGYFPQFQSRPDIGQLLEAIRGELHGDATYTPKGMDVMSQRQLEKAAEEFGSEDQIAAQNRLMEQATSLGVDVDAAPSFEDVIFDIVEELKKRAPSMTKEEINAEYAKIVEDINAFTENEYPEIFKDLQSAGQTAVIDVPSTNGRDQAELQSESKTDSDPEEASAEAGQSEREEASAEAGRVTEEADSDPQQSNEQLSSPSPEVDVTPEGEQTVVRGAEKVSDKTLAERKMEGRKKASKPQKDADEGLFDTGSRKQGDIFDAQPPKESPKSRTVPDENYLTDLSDYTKELYRETSVENALPLLPYSRIMDSSKADLYLSDDKDLALGQGDNKGLILSFDANGLQGKINTAKPTWKYLYEQGSAEYIARHNSQSDFQKRLTSLEIPNDVKMTRVEKSRLKNITDDMKRNGWTEVKGDNSIQYTKGSAKASTASKGTATDVATTAEDSDKKQTITDFGEKIGDARKDVWDSYRDSLSSDLPDDISKITVAKYLPEPDYQKMIDEGTSVELLASIRAIRDLIPAKPRKEWKLKEWAKNVKTARGVTNALLKGTITPSDLVDGVAGNSKFDVFGRRLENELRNTVLLYRDLGYPAFTKAKGYNVKAGSYSKWRGEEYNPPKTLYTITKDSSSPFSNILGGYDTMKEATDVLRDRLTKETEKPSKKKVKLAIYRNTKTGDIYIAKKVAAGKFIDLKTGFDSAKAAREYLLNNEDALLAELEKKKDIPPVRRSSNDPRIGEDYRLGEDTSPERFMDAFKFRGVEFGNYVEQKRRSRDLNNAYDAFRDLANLIGIPTQAISLDGTLGLAFGARGRGGKNAASAHYEPSKVVINLTKRDGAGSLGHEWWHAFDYDIGKRQENGGYLTVNPRLRKINRDGTPVEDPAIRPELVEAFNHLMKEIRTTDLYKRAKELDNTRTKDYWSTDQEVSARAFEAYLIHKSEQKNHKSDYLANILPEGAFEAFYGKGTYPYPTDSEIKDVIAPAFDKLFKELKHKKTDKGYVLYQKSEVKSAKEAVTFMQTTPSGLYDTVMIRSTDDNVTIKADGQGNYSISVKPASKLQSDKTLAGMVGEFVKEGNQYTARTNDAVAAENAISRIMSKNNSTWVPTDQRSRDKSDKATTGKDGTSGLRVKRTADWDSKKKKVANRVKRAAIRSFGAPLKLHFVDYIKTPDGGYANGAYLPARDNDGSIEHIALIALRGDDMKGSLTSAGHEGIHFLRELGALDDHWKALSRKATSEWIDKYNIRERYKGANEALVIEEAIAEAYADYVAGRLTITGKIKAIFDKIKQFISDVRSILTDNQIHRDEDIFTRIYQGDFAQTTGARYTSSNTTPKVTPLYADATIPQYSMALYDKKTNEYIGGARYYESSSSEVIIEGLESTTASSLSVEQAILSHVKERAGGREVRFSFSPERLSKIEKRLPELNTRFQRSLDPHQNATNMEFTYGDQTVFKALFDENKKMWDRIKSATSKEAVQGSIDNARMSLQDRFLGFNRVQQIIERHTGKPIDQQADVYQKQELFSGRAGDKLDLLNNKHIDPLHDALSDFSSKHANDDWRKAIDTVEDYIYAKHAKERNEQISKINKAMPDAGSGMTTAEADKIIAKAESDGTVMALESIAQRIRRMLDYQMKIRVEMGLMDEKTALQLKTKYPNYVPLRGVEEMGDVPDGLPNTGKGFSIKGEESKRAFGRESKARDILANSISIAEEAMIRGEKNRVTESLRKLVEANPNSSLWELNKVERVRVLNKATGLVETRAKPLASGTTLDKKTIYGKRNGEAYRITIHDPRLYEVIKNLDVDKLDGAWKMLMGINRYLSHTHTGWNPEFIITNAFRDLQTGLINLQQYDEKGIAKGTIKDYPKALLGAWYGVRGKDAADLPKWLKKAIKKEGVADDKVDGIAEEWVTHFREFAAAGGKVSFFAMDSVAEKRNKLAKEMKYRQPGTLAFMKRNARAAFEWVEFTNQTIENAIRLSAFVNARRAGMNIENAAQLSKNLTVNFNKRGKMGPKLNALYLFYNASIQGSAVMFRALRSKRVQKVSGGIIAAAFMNDVMNAMMSEEDEDGQLIYDKIPQYEKESNMIFMLPRGYMPDWLKEAFSYGKMSDVYYLKLPMPYGYRMFHEIGRNVSAAGRGAVEPSEAGVNILWSIANNFNPMGGTENLLSFLTPTIGDPVIDIMATNKKFTGAPINPPKNPFKSYGGPDAHSFYKNTSLESRALAQALNDMTGGNEFKSGLIDIHPGTLDHLFHYAVGSAGAFVDRTANAVGKQFTGEELEIYEIPMARKIIGGNPSWVDRSNFYDRRNILEAIHGEWKGFTESGQRDKARELMETHGELIRMYGKGVKQQGTAKFTAKKLSDIRKRVTYIRNDDRMTEPQKKAKIEKLEEQEKKLLNSFNRRFLEATGLTATKTRSIIDNLDKEAK